MHVRDEASVAYKITCISEDAYTNIVADHISHLYTPNYFIRLALGFLTMVAIICSALLMILVFLSATPDISMYLILATINYVTLELLVKHKRYYNAGVDNVLLFSSAAFLLAGIVVYNDFGQEVVVSSVATIVFLYLSIRFVDGFMAIFTYLSLLVCVFLLYTKTGTFAKATAPFLIMIFSAVVYGCVRKLMKHDKYRPYQHCFKSVLLITILTFYVSVNYFVVRELSAGVFGFYIAVNYPVGFGWTFWVLTFVIPVAYVAYGVKKRDPMFIRTGLAFVAVAVLTFRYYYHVLPVEMAMLAGGGFLVAIGYTVMKYLRIPKHGLSFDKHTISNNERINI
jgi:hypothetical protein